jgi:2-polyprenyl-3-methyl-5-hydroxy-6-metoxy-1,4-benzoquinol methylase
MNRAAELVTGRRVLDFGCGQGQFLEILRECGVVGEGADVSSPAVEIVEDKGFPARVWDGGPDVLYARHSFETVCALHVLEHLHNPDEVLARLTELASREVIVAVPNFSSLPARIQVVLGKVPENNTPRKHHIAWFTRGVCASMMRKAGLHNLEWRYDSIWANRPVLGPMMKKLTVVWPALFALTFIVRGERRK